jgi:uncharacterized protein (DUF1778 family)
MKRESSKEAVRRGRPAKPEGEALDSVIPSARCKSDERKAFEKAAKREGVTLTQWVRLTLKNAVEK